MDINIYFLSVYEDLSRDNPALKSTLNAAEQPSCHAAESRVEIGNANLLDYNHQV